MKKIDIKVLFKLKTDQMVANFASNNGFTHPGSKGDSTEKEWLDWFNNNFPPRYKAEKAFVIDCAGNCSDQIDIVIFDNHFSPTIFENNGQKYIPAESVYAVFEVKQDLSKEHIKYAQKKIKSVKSLIRTSAPIHTINGYTKGRQTKILGGLLTIDSGWNPENIEKNIKMGLSESGDAEEEQLDFICCLKQYACAVTYNKEDSNNANGYHLSIQTNKNNSPLLFSYFKLLRMLQDMGNAPAIEFDRYGIEGIDPRIEK